MGNECCPPSGYSYSRSYGCGPGYWVVRRFETRDERKQRLQDYAQALETELKAVNERIEDIDKS